MQLLKVENFSDSTKLQYPITPIIIMGLMEIKCLISEKPIYFTLS